MPNLPDPFGDFEDTRNLWLHDRDEPPEGPQHWKVSHYNCQPDHLVPDEPYTSIPELWYKRDPDNQNIPYVNSSPCRIHPPCHCNNDLCGACCDPRGPPQSFQTRHAYVPRHVHHEVMPHEVKWRPHHQRSSATELTDSTGALVSVLQQFEDVLPVDISEALIKIQKAMAKEIEQGPDDYISQRHLPTALMALATFIQAWAKHPDLAKDIANHVGQNWHFNNIARNLDRYIRDHLDGRLFAFGEKTMGYWDYVQNRKDWWPFIQKNWPTYHWVLVSFILELAIFCKKTYENDQARAQLASAGVAAQPTAAGGAAQPTAAGDATQLAASGDAPQAVATGEAAAQTAPAGEGVQMVAAGDAAAGVKHKHIEPFPPKFYSSWALWEMEVYSGCTFSPWNERTKCHEKVDPKEYATPPPH